FNYQSRITIICDSSFCHPFLSFFFFHATAPSAIYTLSLHDALPICRRATGPASYPVGHPRRLLVGGGQHSHHLRDPRYWLEHRRSEEHTSELQSLRHLVCRLLLEKKKKKKNPVDYHSAHKEHNTESR